MLCFWGGRVLWAWLIMAAIYAMGVQCVPACVSLYAV